MGLEGRWISGHYLSRSRKLNHKPFVKKAERQPLDITVPERHGIGGYPVGEGNKHERSLAVTVIIQKGENLKNKKA